MKYEEFEKRVVDTFNRMHYVDTCDDEFIVCGSTNDVQSILAESFKGMFHIKCERYIGYTVSRDELMGIRADDLDDDLLEALDSFNDIMDRYNVVPSIYTEYTLKVI